MLAQLIKQMIDDTRQGKPARRRLKNGLHMTVTTHKRERATAYALIISRNKVYPSEQEWKTVLKHWPYKIEQVEPSKIVDNDRRMALKAEIPAPAIQEQMWR